MKKQRLGLRKLYHNLDKILLLLFIIFIIMEVVWIPLNSLLADELLRLTGATYLSYTNLGQVFLSKPLITAGFLLLFLANLFMAYTQLGAIFIGVRQLLEPETTSIRGFLKRTFAKVKILIGQFRLSKAFFLLVYAGFLFPFLKRLLKIHYFEKILLPEFIQTYLFAQPMIALLMLTLGTIMLYLAVRWVYALPQLFFEGKSAREAVAYSWDKTRQRFWSTAGQLVWLVIKSSLFFYFWGFLILLVQTFADAFPTRVSFAFALINFVSLRIITYLAIIYFMLLFVTFLTGKTLPDFQQKKRHSWLRGGILAISSAFFTLEGALTILQPADQPSLIISHRGVDRENGVQNTIPALERTAQLKPDLVEMDVQETADGQFVMMHDANLKKLAGINKRPQELTLAELTRLTVRENGQEAPLPSFSDYLKRADELGQKLLIEIKTSSKDSSDMMQRFLKAYGPHIIARGHQMHSLDYKVVTSVRNYSKKIPVYFILPYNTIFPQTQATGYTMEYSSLDENFMTKLWLNQKKVYAWTVNNTAATRQSLLLGVDGIITDELSMVKKAVADDQADRDYSTILSKQLWNYMFIY
ncbi:glycerophosphoryl diester phosphodiesterase membrane domain-containing protein [Streptococcus massiliensis]|uniref:Glycerophosphoryl diester phosphodiesterase family protein n=1 Tax=Streptococcus massiliensis TaxID=313439 RepID=A0A380L1C5_9STRE|nr:glycerophosphodiester phosphodiesterase [Streptococcus massiliensis]SUN77228.1 glycerophosphoryl diester phosphodiesterase family protein [Streptococcus massiliensis]